MEEIWKKRCLNFIDLRCIGDYIWYCNNEKCTNVGGSGDEYSYCECDIDVFYCEDCSKDFIIETDDHDDICKDCYESMLISEKRKPIIDLINSGSYLVPIEIPTLNSITFKLDVKITDLKYHNSKTQYKKITYINSY